MNENLTVRERWAFYFSNAFLSMRFTIPQHKEIALRWQPLINAILILELKCNTCDSAHFWKVRRSVNPQVQQSPFHSLHSSAWIMGRWIRPAPFLLLPRILWSSRKEEQGTKRKESYTRKWVQAKERPAHQTSRREMGEEEAKNRGSGPSCVSVGQLERTACRPKRNLLQKRTFHFREESAGLL